MYLNWSCLKYYKYFKGSKNVGIGEGLWYIITSGHKESQHFHICAGIYFLSHKQMSEIEKKTKKGKHLPGP